MSTTSTVGAREFLSVLHGEDAEICFRAILPKGVSGETFKYLGTLRDKQDELTRANKQRGIYFVVNRGGDTNDSITRFTACFVEDDKRTLEEQNARLDACPLRTSVRVETLRSVHSYFFLRGACRAEQWIDAQLRLIAFLDGDPAIKNPSRVMRVPGFGHISKDGTRKLVVIAQFNPERVYTIEEILASLPPVPKDKRAERNNNARTHTPPGPTHDRRAIVERARKYLAAIPGAIEGSNGDTHTFATCCKLVRDFGLSEGEAVDLLADWNSRCQPPWSERELQQKVENAARYGDNPIGWKLDEPKPNGNTSRDTGMEKSNVIAKRALDRSISELESNVRLRVVDAAGLLTAVFPPRAYVLHPILQTQSLTMIYSYRGLGKTYLAMGIGLAVAAGGRILKWNAPSPRKVLYIDGEMPGVSMQGRLSSIVAGMDAEPQPGNFRIITPDLQPLELPFPYLSGTMGQKMIEGEMEGTELLIIDNLSCLTRGIENESESWVPMQEWALSLRRRGVSVLFLHHAGKAGAQRGTSKREDILDTVISLKRPADYVPAEGARFEVHFEKCRGIHGDVVEPFEVRLAMDERGAAAWVMANIENLTASKAAVLFADGMTVRDVADELKISRSKAHRLKGAK